MLATLIAATQPIRGSEYAALDYFAIVAALAGILLWIVAVNYRSRHTS